VDFRILGRLEVWRDGAQVELRKPRERALLALLLLRANEVIARDELIDVLWHGAPPRTAKASLHNAVAGLRRSLGASTIETVGAGYRANVKPAELDALRFEELVADARGATPELRTERLREALREWRGHPLTEYPFADSQVIRLEELHLNALEERIDAELELGRAAELVPELRALTTAYPVRERFWAQLMLALYRSGRSAEALSSYRSAHAAFVEELGLEPGMALRELQRSILLQDAALLELHRGPDLIERAANFLPTTEAGRAEALYDYAIALSRGGDHMRARSALLECERRAQQLGNRGLAIRARARRAMHAGPAGEITLRELEQITEQALVDARAEGDPLTLAETLRAHANTLREVGLADDAATEYRELLDVALEMDDRWREGMARNELGLVLMLGTTPVDDALAECERHLESLEWSSPGPVGLWVSLAMLKTQLGHAEEGTRYMAQARDTATSAGAASLLTLIEIFAAWAATILGDSSHAKRQAATALELVDSLGHAGVHGDVASLLARLEAESGHLERADDLIRSARPWLERMSGAAFLHVSLRRAEAAVARARGDDSGAEVALRDACNRAAASHFLTLHGETLEDAGDLTAALVRFKRKGDIASAARIRTRLQREQ